MKKLEHIRSRYANRWRVYGTNHLVDRQSAF